MRSVLTALATVAAVALPFSVPADAQVKIKLEEYVGGLTHPLAMVTIPDGSGRKAVIEQHGLVRIIDARGRLLPEPFLNIQSKLVHLEPFFEEQGLLGIAFHPNYRTNGKFYIAYSAPLQGDAPLDRKLWWAHTNTVSEMTVSKDNANKANANSEKIISQIDWPQFNHNGHWIEFGPDGKLYLSTGDGGYANDWGIGHNVTIGNGQDLTSKLGKILRLDVDKDDYIPTDNPFLNRADAEPLVWAYGLRNPWRCSFDMGGEWKPTSASTSSIRKCIRRPAIRPGSSPRSWSTRTAPRSRKGAWGSRSPAATSIAAGTAHGPASTSSATGRSRSPRWTASCSSAPRARTVSGPWSRRRSRA
jgi:glucose/arabinose dehydrogenase